MSIHITFTDGSNPYVRFNMSAAEFRKELRSWRRNFKLDGFINGGIYYVVAEPKVPAFI